MPADDPEQTEAQGESRTSKTPRTPRDILADAFQRASAAVLINDVIIADDAIRKQIESVCRSWNRAPVRFLLACSLAKAYNPTLDIRKPYTEIPGSDHYSGRDYDQNYIDAFIKEHGLPGNATTAFLTPAFRTKNLTLTLDIKLGGRPAHLYEYTLQLLSEVYEGRVVAEDLLTEIIRFLLLIREENRMRLESALAELAANASLAPLSSEGIVMLISQHLASERASRLPVLVIAAAYTTIAAYIGEQVQPLESHNAADSQTGSLGDVEITVVGDDNVMTTYEVKDKRVTRNDVDNALTKVQQFYQQHKRHVDNYIFITTETIEMPVQEYAKSLYGKTGGVEFIILDCISFLRHFLHLFHRLRLTFLDTYQALVLAEPDSAVGQPLKEAFLALRRASESQMAEALSTDAE